MADGPNKIADALQRYRETVLQHNFLSLEILVRGIEKRSATLNVREEDIPKYQLRAFSGWQGFLQGELPPSVSSIQDILSPAARTELAERFLLDGTHHVEQERAQWFNTIQAIISEKAKDLDIDVQFPPDDLKYLCSLGTIIGAGLPYTRQLQIEFISRICNENRVCSLERVIVPLYDEQFEDHIMAEAWRHWEIAAACKLGDGVRGAAGSYIVYCRKREESSSGEEDDNDENDKGDQERDKEWSWRYGIHDDEWASKLYRSVSEFLDMYARLGEQTNEETEQDVKFNLS